MAGAEEAVQSVGRRWQIPQAVQELLSAIVVALLLPGVVGLFGMWNSIGNLTSSLDHMKSQQALIHAQHDTEHLRLDGRIGELFLWKDTFGAKERFGKDDGKELKDLINKNAAGDDKKFDRVDRRITRLAEKFDIMQFAKIDHEKRANTYIEKIEQGEKIDDNQSAAIQHLTELITNHLFREEQRGTP